jgi:hypothetical protein
MEPIHFVYWLQGYLELDAADGADPELTPEQVKCIKDHLALVLRKKTPEREEGVKKKKKKKSADTLGVTRVDSGVVDEKKDPPMSPKFDAERWLSELRRSYSRGRDGLIC